jgi:hypothetical protein
MYVNYNLLVIEKRYQKRIELRTFDCILTILGLFLMFSLFSKMIHFMERMYLREWLIIMAWLSLYTHTNF